MNAIVPPGRDDVQDVSARILLLKLAKELITAADTELRDYANSRMEHGERVPGVVDGRTLGAVTKPAASYTARVSDRAALLAWVRENRPEQIRRSINATPEIVEALAAMWPEAVVEEVQPGYENALLKEAKEAGMPPGDEQGEVIPGIEVTQSKAHVSTSKLPEDAYEIAWDAWQSGQLAQIVASPLPELEAPEAGPAPEPVGVPGE